MIHPLQVCIMGTSLHPITNWPQYNKSLINRGSLTFWVDTDAMHKWFHQDHHGYGAAASSTATRASAPLMLKGNFSLTLRATQGLLYSLFALMNVPLCLSDYSGASKRVSTVTVAYRQPFKAKVTNLVIGKAIGRSENTAQRSGESGASCIWQWTRPLTISWQHKSRWKMSIIPRCCPPCSTHCGAVGTCLCG